MMTEEHNQQGRTGGIINIDYQDRRELYKAYMPFVKNGGLFIPTNKSFSLGDELFIVLGLPEENEKIPVSCRVVWVTPVAAEGNRTPGIGLQFRDSGTAHQRIENCLGGMLKSEDTTYTM